MPELTLQPEILDADIRCARCGYNLRGLAISGRCPECALQVIESVDEARHRRIRLGTPLTEQSARWQRLMGWGFIIFLAAAVEEGALTLWDLRRGSSHEVLRVLIAMGTSAIMCLAVWLFTTAPQGEVKRSSFLRWSSRMVVTAASMFFAALMLIYLIRRPSNIIWGAMILWTLNSVATIVAFAYLADVAARLQRLLLKRICLVMSGAALMFLLETAGVSGWISFRFLHGMVHFPGPDQPVIGPVYGFAWRLINLRFFSNGIFTDLLEELWVPCAVGVLVWFAILFTQLARREDLPRNSDASSRP